jgi:hypothetical protein
MCILNRCYAMARNTRSRGNEYTPNNKIIVGDVTIYAVGVIAIESRREKWNVAGKDFEVLRYRLGVVYWYIENIRHIWILVYWIVTPCSFVRDYLYFDGSFCFHLQRKHIKFSLCSLWKWLKCYSVQNGRSLPIYHPRGRGNGRAVDFHSGVLGSNDHRDTGQRDL